MALSYLEVLRGVIGCSGSQLPLFTAWLEEMCNFEEMHSALHHPWSCWWIQMDVYLQYLHAAIIVLILILVLLGESSLRINCRVDTYTVANPFTTTNQHEAVINIVLHCSCFNE
jgi:hypothetical protein